MSEDFPLIRLWARLSPSGDGSEVTQAPGPQMVEITTVGPSVPDVEGIVGDRVRTGPYPGHGCHPDQNRGRHAEDLGGESDPRCVLLPLVTPRGRLDFITTVLILAKVLMDVLTHLRDAGVAATAVAQPRSVADHLVNTVIEVAADGAPTRFAVEERRRAPYPGELSQLDQQRRLMEKVGVPLLVVPYVPELLGNTLTAAGWSWADDQGNFDLRALGLRLRQRRTTSSPKPTRRTLPGGSGSWAIIRSLISFTKGEEEQPSATALAAQAQVTQPRASQVLAALSRLGLVERTSQGRWLPDRAALLDRFLTDYPGPGGSERYLYSLDTPSEVAITAAHRAGPRALAVSADVGPDLVTPWKRPSVVIVYLAEDIDLKELGLTQAQGSADANVLVRAPRDRSVFPTPPLVAKADGVEIALADPTQMLWDLHDLGGADRLEAAAELREWLLTRH